MNRVVFKSLSDEWRTPKSVYDALDAEFGFVYDPCPMDDQELWDSLYLPWKTPAFCNPPYSDIAAWVKKAFEESARGVVVLLIPSRTDTKWWHSYVMQAREIRFIKGRLKFGEAKTGAPFPSCVVVFDRTANNDERRQHAFILQVAERLYNAACVLARRAEKRDKPDKAPLYGD